LVGTNPERKRDDSLGGSEEVEGYLPGKDCEDLGLLANDVRTELYLQDDTPGVRRTAPELQKDI